MSDIKVEEITFQVALGLIAAKWWGSKEKRPIVMLHGWLDNAGTKFIDLSRWFVISDSDTISGTFDTLIPLLPSNYSYLAIDLPGHGLSSHIPNGYFYHVQDYVAILEEMRVKFNWKKLSLMGHSMGDTICFTYAAIYPNRVELVCALDSLKTSSLPKFALFMTMKHMQSAYAMRDTQNQQNKEYTYDQMSKFVSKASIEPSKVICLLKRCVKISKHTPNKFQFTHDIRLHCIQPFNLSHKQSLHYIKHICAPHLYVKSDDQTYDDDPQMFNETIDQFKQHCRHFEMVKVAGTHHVHLNNPELIAAPISAFLTKFHTEETNGIGCLRPIESKM